MLTLTHTFSPCSTSSPPSSPPILRPQSHSLHLRHHTSLFNPLRSKLEMSMEKKKKKIGRIGNVVVCYAAPPLTTTNLQWIATVSSVVLMFAKGTAIQKSFLVPFFALQAPASLVSWIKGEYGIWTAFLALLVRLFFYIPGELELPFIALLMVIVSPYQLTNLRGRQEGIALSLVIAAFMAFQHFTRVGSLRRAFDQGSIIATLAILCVVAMPCLLLI
uniref:cold-regulated 413 inner membrane protein 2, chloroplastic-like n=1 Tax=Erigeron canadensis TaxID=72917 RepID=UPI001CB924DB|nr:cold-regulated 413 inner membrane protein 2, chloroplastic-like [Erigeron canadensis]